MEDLIKKWGAVAIQVDAEARIAYCSTATETLANCSLRLWPGASTYEDIIQPLHINNGYRHAVVECIRSISTTGHVFSPKNPLRVPKVKGLAYDPVTHPYEPRMIRQIARKS